MSKILEQEMESKIKVLEKQTVELTQKNDLLKEDLNKTKVIPGVFQIIKLFSKN